MNTHTQRKTEREKDREIYVHIQYYFIDDGTDLAHQERKLIETEEEKEESEREWRQKKQVQTNKWIHQSTSRHSDGQTKLCKLNESMNRTMIQQRVCVCACMREKYTKQVRVSYNGER